MNQFFSRWRLSRLHDDDREPSPEVRARLQRSDSLARYARTLERIDRELTGQAPIVQPPPELRRRTLEMIARTPGRTAQAPRAPLWPLLTSLTVAATSLMLFVARPWHTPPRPAGPAGGAVASELSGHIQFVDDRIRRETTALVDDTRRLANSLFHDALPFASGK